MVGVNIAIPRILYYIYVALMIHNLKLKDTLVTSIKFWSLEKVTSNFATGLTTKNICSNTQGPTIASTLLTAMT